MIALVRGTKRREEKNMRGREKTREEEIEDKRVRGGRKTGRERKRGED